MSARVSRAAHRVARPWKNGGGETWEVALWPPHADDTDFDWRVSLAVVASDGPFSMFPGVDRTLLVVDGDGLALHIGDAPPVRVGVASAALSFAGEAVVEARLRGGPARVLNVMTRRGVCSARARRLTLDSRMDFIADAQACVIVLSGGVECAHERPEGRLETGDAVCFEGAAPITLQPLAKQTSVATVCFGPPSGLEPR